MQRLQDRFRSESGPSELRVPESFVDFCSWLGVALTPAQAELTRVAYDGSLPVDRALAEKLFGTAKLSMAPRAVVGAVCGARGGKSYVLVALRLVHGMYVRDLSPLAPGQHAAALVVAQNDGLRREVVRYAVGAVRSHPGLARTLEGEPSADAFRVRRPDGHVVEFLAGVATRGGYGARGRWWTDFAMDECAFFRDQSAKVNDLEIFNAGSARVLPGGQTILASTPWAEVGLLYDLWRENYGKPVSALVAHAPTLLLNDSQANRDIVNRARAVSPESAKCEFDAQFMTSGTTVFFDGGLIESATTEEPFTPQPGDVIAAGADFGFRSDSSSLLLVAMRSDGLHVFHGVELKPQDGQPLKPSETVGTFAQAIAGRCGYVMADQHYREAIAEHLDAHDLSYAPAPTKPADTYVRARMLMREGRVRLHPFVGRDRLIQQMREVHGKPTSGGGLSIVHPRWATGGHGDLCAALVLALWQVSGDEVPAPEPVFGSADHEAQLYEARVREYREQREREGDGTARWGGRRGDGTARWDGRGR